MLRQDHRPNVSIIGISALTPDTSSGLSPQLQQIANQAYFLRGKAIGAYAQIELAQASKSLEEAARIMKRKPERIRKVAIRLGVSFKTEAKKN